MMKIAFVLAAATAVLTTAPLATPTKAQELKMAQGIDVSGGTATTATIGIVGAMTPPSALAQGASPSAHGSAAAWSLRRLNGATVRSRAGSAAATKTSRNKEKRLFKVGRYV
jgi:hypothetical protein